MSALAEAIHDGSTFRPVPSLRADPPTDAQRQEAESIGLLLAEFLDTIATAIVTRCPEDGSLHIDWTDGEGRRHRVQRGRPLELLQAALGREVRQRCRCCGEWKTLSCFGGDKARPNGRLQRCKPCETARMREYKRRKRHGAVVPRPKVEGEGLSDAAHLSAPA